MLATFKYVEKILGEAIGLDEGTPPTATLVETLKQSMLRLDACSTEVSGLPEKGIAVSCQCMGAIATGIQRSASNLVGKSTGNP